MKTSLILSLTLMACVHGQPSPQVATGIEVGIDATKCFLERFVANESKGMGEVEAGADAAAICGLTALQGAGLLSTYRKATMLESQIRK